MRLVKYLLVYFKTKAISFKTLKENAAMSENWEMKNN